MPSPRPALLEHHRPADPLRPLRVAGSALFLGALGLALWFALGGAYRIEAGQLDALFGSRADLVAEAAPDFPGRTFRGKPAFLAALRRLSEAAADGARARYGWTEADVDAIVARNAGRPFDLAATAAAFEEAGHPEKARAAREWLGWYDGQTLPEADLRPQMADKAASVNARIAGLDLSADAAFALVRAGARGLPAERPGLAFWLVFGLGALGAALRIGPDWARPPGIRNDGVQFDRLNSRGWTGILLGGLLIAFYVTLYWFPGWIADWSLLLDPMARALTGGEASRWFVYGWLYTFAVGVMALRFAAKYRHNRYQLLRTASVTFFQIGFAFLIANLLARLNLPARDLKNIWPLDYTFFTESSLDGMLHAPVLPGVAKAMFGLGLAWIVIGVPVLTYFYGKRWYCSWVCGCGGLAETAGDPFRHLSDNSLAAWRVERWTIHSVLVFAVVMTAGVVYGYVTGADAVLGVSTSALKQTYGFAIGAVFAGVVGTGFYPLMGNRVWCRFGCPLAAYLGIVQRFKSRFRITTNGGQCISCGNCSAYCEQGIDVRWYAQRGQNIVRASCVGCGICSAVCPRGVLNLENGPDVDRAGVQALKLEDGGVRVLH